MFCKDWGAASSLGKAITQPVVAVEGLQAGGQLGVIAEVQDSKEENGRGGMR